MAADGPLGDERPEDSVDRRQTEAAVLESLFGEPSESGRFRRIRFLGRGAMGRVELAEDTMLDRRVALKRLTPRRAGRERARDRVKREARALAQIEHPAVVRLYDVLEEGEQLTLVMEYVEGPTLRAWLAQRHSTAEIRAVLLAAARGLAAAHTRGVVHRDVKPDNIIVLPGGTAKVIDFGLAFADGSVLASEPAAGEPDAPDAITRTGAVVGTPAYMAPEQFLEGPVDARCDQFALCVVAWEALVGTRPFRGDTSAAVAENVARGRVDADALRRLPRRLRPVLLRGLSTDPGDRYHDMTALAAALGHDPRTRAVIGVGVLAVGATAWGVGRWGREPAAPQPDPCAAVDARADEIWTTERAERLRSRLGAAGPGFATRVADRVVERSDAWVSTWRAETIRLCRRNAAAATPTSACLDTTLDEFDTVARGFEALEGPRITRALTALDRVANPRRCGRPAFVESAFSEPDDSAVSEARALRLEAQSELAQGHYEAALPLASKARASVARGTNVALDAELELTLARAHFQLDQTDEAERAYLDAANAAESSAYDELAAVIWSEFAQMAGLQRVDAERMRFYIERADAAVNRLGNPPLQRAIVEQRRGQAEIAAGRPAAAVPYLERGLALVEHLPHGQRTRSAIATDLGRVAYSQGEFDAAITAFETLVSANLRALGPEHPSVADARHNLGSVMVAAGRLDEARGVLAVALEGRKRIYGARHEKVAGTLNSIASIAFSQERYDEALEGYTTVSAMRRAAQGPHVKLADALANRGRALTGLERYDEADAAFDEAATMLLDLVGEDHLGYADALSGWASSRALAGDPNAAVERYEHVVAVRETGLGADAPRTLRTVLELARAEHQAGRTAAARERLDTLLANPKIGDDLAEDARALRAEIET